MENIAVLDEKDDNVILDDREKMIYDFLFSDETLFYIDLNKYTTTEFRSDFREDIRGIIKKGGYKIKDDRIVHTHETTVWKIEIDKSNG